jgi:hypothetical protein
MAVTLARETSAISERRACVADAQRTIEAWRVDYNVTRPHSGLGSLPPQAFARSLQTTAS